MKKLLLVVFLFNLACQHQARTGASEKKQKSNEETLLFEQSSADPLSLVKEGLRRENAEKYGKASREIINLLQKAKVPSVGKEYYVYNLFCHVIPRGDVVDTTCTYFTKGPDQKKRAKKSFSGPVADELRMAMSVYPVTQGDSGASTSFLYCQDNSADMPACDLAIDLNYAGP